MDLQCGAARLGPCSLAPRRTNTSKLIAALHAVRRWLAAAFWELLTCDRAAIAGLDHPPELADHAWALTLAGSASDACSSVDVLRSTSFRSASCKVRQQY